jgi:hypothetical protein
VKTSLDAVVALENRAVGAHGEPMLGAALNVALDAWRSGNRDRELRLHLLFLSWYCNLEPPHLTGYVEAFPSVNLCAIFAEVFRSFGDEASDDAEFLFVVGLMATLTPWLLGDDEETWRKRAQRYQSRYRALAPSGLAPEIFADRGAYGDYFSGQLAVAGGF